MPERQASSDLKQMLDSVAMLIRREREFKQEFSAGELDALIRSTLESSQEALRKAGASATIERLKVEIASGKAICSTAITASKKLGLLNPKATINADFGLANVMNAEGKPNGEIKTEHLAVSPQTLFMVIKPYEFLAPHLEGENINNTLRGVLGGEMEKRGVKINSLSLVFNDRNMLEVSGAGSSL